MYLQFAGTYNFIALFCNIIHHQKNTLFYDLNEEAFESIVGEGDNAG